MRSSLDRRVPTYFPLVWVPPFRVVLPVLWDPPVKWKARIREINRRLDDPHDQLAIDFLHAYETGKTRGNTAAEEAIRGIVERNRDLFPGEAGRELAWSTLCRAEPPLERPARDRPIRARELFANDVPDYTAPAGGGRRHRYRARTRTNTRDEFTNTSFRDLLQDLRGSGRHVPTPEQVAARHGMTLRELHRRLSRARTTGHVRIPTTKQMNDWRELSQEPTSRCT
jgi:hypothetical protein